MNIINNVFYNVLSAAAVIQRFLFRRYFSLSGYRILRAILSCIAVILFLWVFRLTGHPFLAQLVSIIPIAYLFIFIRQDKEGRLEEKIAEFKAGSRIIRIFYCSLIIFLFFLIPAALLIYALVK